MPTATLQERIIWGARPEGWAGGRREGPVGKPRPQLFPAWSGLSPQEGDTMSPHAGHKSPFPATATNTQTSPASLLRGQDDRALPCTLPPPHRSVLWKVLEGGACPGEAEFLIEG